MIGTSLNLQIDPFTFEGTAWCAWIFIGILLVLADLKFKVKVGHLSIAALITVLASFYVEVSSQILIFLFFSALSILAGHAHKEHLEKLKHHFIH
jgi:membrane protein implicated in regulation of membrane protease activity